MCMCGDTYCKSCGPAQGNHYCPYCKSWSEDGGCPEPEKCKEADDKFCDEMAAMAKYEAEHKEEIEQSLQDIDAEMERMMIGY